MFLVWRKKKLCLNQTFNLLHKKKLNLFLMKVNNFLSLTYTVSDDIITLQNKRRLCNNKTIDERRIHFDFMQYRERGRKVFFSTIGHTLV